MVKNIEKLAEYGEVYLKERFDSQDKRVFVNILYYKKNIPSMTGQNLKETAINSFKCLMENYNLMKELGIDMQEYENTIKKYEEDLK